MQLRMVTLALAFATFQAHADSSTLDAAIGGGLGGAAGAAIGNEVGGRDGAIVGGAVGGALGAAVTTDDSPSRTIAPAPRPTIQVAPAHCPPGQRKKGRC